MDLGSIFGLNSRFGAVLGGINPFSALASLTLAETSVYQRVTSDGFSDLLEDGAPALPVICWSFTDSKVIVALGELRVCDGGHWMM